MTPLTLIIGANGGIGQALVQEAKSRYRDEQVLGFSRASTPSLDLEVEPSIEQCAASVASQSFVLKRLIVATGFLHDTRFSPEKSTQSLSSDHLLKSFMINAVGPALVLKHFLPLLPKESTSHVAVISARVGSIADNRQGGWHAYRASKAALNQVMRTCAVELARKCPKAVLVSLHPGTVDTNLSAPFSAKNYERQAPNLAAERLLEVLDSLTPAQTGGFFDHHGKAIEF